jgi:hypothetical protein
MIYKATQAASDWKSLLAKPEKQWKTGFSAKTLAHCWEEAKGFPRCVISALNKTNGPFTSIKPLLIFPEHKVPLPGGKAASQCDIWILAKDDRDLVSIAVEGKVAETFGPTMKEWMIDASDGKNERIQFLQSKLELDNIPDSIRYQLLHRTVAAILSAERFEARHAVLLVQSFSDQNRGFSEFRQFVDLFGLTADLNRTKAKQLQSGLNLHFSWVEGEKEFLTR